MWALLALAGGVGSDRGALDDQLGVHRDGIPAHAHDEAVEAARRRAALLFTDSVVLGPVAGALEPLRALAPRHPAAEVHTLLIEGDHAGFHAGNEGGVG